MVEVVAVEANWSELNAIINLFFSRDSLQLSIFFETPPIPSRSCRFFCRLFKKVGKEESDFLPRVFYRV